MEQRQVEYNSFGVEIDQDDKDLDTFIEYTRLQECLSKRANCEELSEKELTILSVYDEEV